MYRAKSYASVLLADKILFVPSDTFAVGCIFSLQNAPEKESKNANASFFETQTTTRALINSALSLTAENLRRSTSRTLLVTLELIEFGCVHKI